MLDGRLDSHLSASDIDKGIDQVQVGKLAVRSVINNVKSFESLVEGIVERKSSL